MSEIRSSELRPLSALEQNLLGVPGKESLTLLPGLLAAVALAAFSLWFADALGTRVLGYPTSPVAPGLVAIVLGLLLNNLLPLPAVLEPGLAFSVKKVLRLGIILLGIRLSLLDVLKLGAVGVPIVLVC